MDKFGRNYELYVQTQTGGTLKISLPFTIEFDITKNTLTSANVCQVRIYNLSPENRNQLRYNISDFGKFRQIQLFAGYGTSLTKIFTGNISQAWSVREGVNFITQIECYDGGFAFNTGFTDKSFPAGTPEKTVMQDMGASLPNVTLGAVGNYTGVLSRGNTYSGNTMAMLKDLSSGGAFINNGVLNILKDNEVIAGDNFKINASTGLLGTPVLEESIARFEMLFEPKLDIGKTVSIESVTEQNFNGLYKITSVKHRGMISESVAGSVTTTGEFIFFKLLEAVRG